MTTIIRIEHTDGWGIFRAPWVASKRSRPCIDTLCPQACDRHLGFHTPTDDGYPINSDDYFCAYKTLDDMKRWLNSDEIRILLENGFKVFLLEVSDCFLGVDNAIFKKQDILLKKDISDLFR